MSILESFSHEGDHEHTHPEAPIVPEAPNPTSYLSSFLSFLTSVKTIFNDNRKKIDDKLSETSPTKVIFATAVSVVLLHFVRKAAKKASDAIKTNEKGFLNVLLDVAIGIGNNIPAVKRKLDAEIDEMVKQAKEEYAKNLAVEGPVFENLPEKGVTHKDLIEMFQKFLKKNPKGKKSLNPEMKISASTYLTPSDTKHLRTVIYAYNFFCTSNALYYDQYPALCKFEREILKITRDLLHGGPNVRGIVTSGGTESILLAVKAYRDYYLSKRCFITPTIVASESVHPAFDKACHYLNVKLIKLKMDPESLKFPVKRLHRYMNRNVIAIIGGAPAFPHGIIDPIEDLAVIAKKWGCGLHVDSCLGGFYLPFAQRLGYDIPNFDFLVDGVTSISADVHKYGLSPKGVSTLSFNSSELRNSAFYVQPFWVGGHYATATSQGSRNGGILASAWASLLFQGMEGFFDKTRKIHQTTRKIIEGCSTIPGIKIGGEPKASMVSFFSANPKKMSIYQVLDGMKKRGWKMGGIQNPDGIHFCVTFKNVGCANEFVKDMAESVSSISENPKLNKEDSAAFYGMSMLAPKRLIKYMGNAVLGYFLDGE